MQAPDQHSRTGKSSRDTITVRRKAYAIDGPGPMPTSITADADERVGRKPKFADTRCSVPNTPNIVEADSGKAIPLGRKHIRNPSGQALKVAHTTNMRDKSVRSQR